MVYEKKCRHCRKVFITEKNQSRYCSKDCQFEHTHTKYNCDYCNEVFYASNALVEDVANGRKQHLYCSRRCASGGAIKERTKIICKLCGKEFLVTDSSTYLKYCSQKCYNEDRGDLKKLSRKACPICGKIFTTYHHNQICCCKDCNQKRMSKKILAYCENCGVSVERKPSEYKKNKNCFCSMDCKRDYYAWDEEDVAVLSRWYGEVSKAEIQKMLSKEYSKKAISSKARTLGLCESKSWSKAEVDILKKYYTEIPMTDLLKLLPNRSQVSIFGKAHSMGLTSYFYNNHLYSEKEIEYLNEKYLVETNEELAKSLNRTPYAIEQKLRLLGLKRPVDKKYDTYKTLSNLIRNRIKGWRKRVLREFGYKCYLTGDINRIVVHHCRSVGILLQEAMETLGIEVEESYSDYSSREIEDILSTFLYLQSSYKEYVVVSEDIHIAFHKEYGFGNNTNEQWIEFCHAHYPTNTLK